MCDFYASPQGRMKAVRDIVCMPVFCLVQSAFVASWCYWLSTCRLV